MKKLLLLLALCAITISRINCIEEDDNDFADFEVSDFDEEPMETVSGM